MHLCTYCVVTFPGVCPIFQPDPSALWVDCPTSLVSVATCLGSLDRIMTFCNAVLCAPVKARGLPSQPPLTLGCLQLSKSCRGLHTVGWSCCGRLLWLLDPGDVSSSLPEPSDPCKQTGQIVQKRLTVYWKLIIIIIEAVEGKGLNMC